MHRMIVTIFALLFLCGITANAAAQERLNFVYISPNAGSSSVFWVAKDMGLFKKHGLDVNVIYIEGTPKALMALFAGELQVVAGTGPAVARVACAGARVAALTGRLVVTSAISVAAWVPATVGPEVAQAHDGSVASRRFIAGCAAEDAGELGTAEHRYLEALELQPSLAAAR